jgi:hypothetical protein
MRPVRLGFIARDFFSQARVASAASPIDAAQLTTRPQA